MGSKFFDTPVESDRTLNKASAARRLRCSLGSIRHLVESHVLPVRRGKFGAWVFAEKDVEALRLIFRRAKRL